MLKLINGAWSGYGPACTIGMETQPEVTDLRLSYCDLSYDYPTGADFVLAQTVQGASAYEWRATPVGGGTAQTDMTAGIKFRFSQTSIDLSAGGQWVMEVRAIAGGAIGEYVTGCQVTIDTGTPSAPLEDEVHASKSLISSLSLNLYPNPNDGSEFRIAIEGLDDMGMVELRLRDVQGRLIASQRYVHHDKTSFLWTNDRPLDAGVYILETQVGTERLTTRFTVR